MASHWLLFIKRDPTLESLFPSPHKEQFFIYLFFSHLNLPIGQCKYAYIKTFGYT